MFLGVKFGLTDLLCVKHLTLWNSEWKQWYRSNQLFYGFSGATVQMFHFADSEYVWMKHSKCFSRFFQHTHISIEDVLEWNRRDAFQNIFRPPLKFPARLFKTPWSTLAIKSNEGENIFGQKYDQINPAQLIWIKQILSKFYEI